MPTAQPVCLRASCLRWLPRESRHFSDSSNIRLPFLRPGYHERNTVCSPRGLRSASSKASNRTNKPTRDATRGAGQDKRPSLMEELFPEEAPPKPQTSTRPKERDIPRLDVRASLPQGKPKRPEQSNLVRKMNKTNDNWWNRTTEAVAPEPTPAQDSQKRPRVEGVLMLRNASKTLIEDDFTRLIPQGLHIEGWALDQADIIKVVPGRNTSTLERTNFYFILFRSRPAMNAYRSHVMSLHSLASRHVQSSLTSPIPPPPGYHLNGQDVDALLQIYTLVPPDRTLQLLPLPMQVSPSVNDIINNLGYPAIVKAPLKQPYIVMVRLEGPQLPTSMARGIFMKAERERRSPWNGEFGNLPYHTWAPTPKNISPLDRKSRLDEDGDHKSWLEEIEEVAEMDSEFEGNERTDNQPGTRERRKVRCSHLLGFDTEDAALTFVQYWHRRPLDLTGMNYSTDDVAPVVDAELLW